MSYSEEFRTVDLVINSSTETRGVDAFALSLIKTERQMRKLVTHIDYQFPCFSPSDVPNLRAALERNRRVYLDGFERGFNALYIRMIKDLVGTDYDTLHARVVDAISCRNKVFHGQLTSLNLTQKELLDFVSDIRTWCEVLAVNANSKFQHDGFVRNSFQKSKITELSTRFKVQLGNIAEYERFIHTYMERL